jgi:hypothetical protein
MGGFGRVLMAGGVVLAGLAMAPAGASADEHHYDFHGRAFAHFGPEEARIWRGGHWAHEWHDGRYAWWWVADGGWYFYPEPIYPYPTYVPPAVVTEQPPPVPTGAPPMASWYFCDNPQGYYPYVASCAVPWRPVPATPQPPPSAPAPQAAPAPPPR